MTIAGTELSSYSRVTTEMASLVAKYKLLRAFGWEIARESGKINFSASTCKKSRGQVLLLFPFPSKPLQQKPRLTFLIKARPSSDRLQFCFRFPCQPGGEILYQLLYLKLIIENLPVLCSRALSQLQAVVDQAHLQAEKSEVKVNAHTNIMSGSNFK